MHLICFRETTHPSAILRPGLLSRFRKWTYPAYVFRRSDGVWATRKDLLDYEEALELEQALKELLEATDEGAVRQASQAPAAFLQQPKTIPLTPTNEKANVVKLEVVTKAEALQEDEDPPAQDDRRSAKVRRLKKVKQLFQECIWPRWQQHLGVQANKEKAPRTPGFERFEIGT